MNKNMVIGLVSSLLIVATQNLWAEPSRVFIQETMAIESKDSVSVDLDYPLSGSGLAAGLRMGALDGVILINSESNVLDTRTGFDASSVGFKKMVNNKVAAYGKISYFNVRNTLNNNSGTDIAIGFAYTAKNGTLTYNINPEFITDERGDRGLKDTIFLKAAAMIPLTGMKVGQASAIAEVALENNSNLDSIVNLGLRWVPRKDITLDFILYSDRGNPAVNGNVDDVAKGIPGMIKANIRF